MLKQRIMTGILLALLTVACIFLLPANFFILLCSGVILMASWEWGPLMGLNQPSQRWLFVSIMAILLMMIDFIVPLSDMWQSNGELTTVYYAILWLGMCWWCLSILLIFSFPQSAILWRSNLLLRGLIAICSLVPAWVALIAIRTMNMHVEGQFYDGAVLLLISMVIVWAADIGAYFSGKKYGRHKLMPEVSPNKTIEGFVGGLIWVAALVILLKVVFQFDKALLPLYLLIAVLTAMVSAVGDLNESMLKRNAGIKDSGSLLPGHGGLLDRIDSLVAAMPMFILLYSTLLV